MYEEILKSEVQYDNVDMQLCGVYLTIMLSKEELDKEGLTKLVPNRKAQSGRGRRPTIHTKELGGPRRRSTRPDNDQEDLVHIGKCLDEELDDQEEVISKWHKFYRPYTATEKKRLVAKVVQIALEQCFSNHIYQADNTLYRQVSEEE